MRNMQNMHLNSDPWLQPGLVGGLRAALRQKGGYVLGGLFAAFGVAWTLTEASAFFFSAVDNNRCPVIVVLVIVVAFGSVFLAIPARLVRLRFGATDVEVGFGDIFHADGVRIVAVNDFFDSELGEYVSPRSVHGQLIERDFRSSAAQFASSVRDALVGVPSEQVERTGGHSERFPVGTTAVLDVGAQRYVLVVLARTDVQLAEGQRRPRGACTRFGRGMESGSQCGGAGEVWLSRCLAADYPESVSASNSSPLYYSRP